MAILLTLAGIKDGFEITVNRIITWLAIAVAIIVPIAMFIFHYKE